MAPFSEGSGERECPGKLLWKQQNGPPLEPSADSQPPSLLTVKMWGRKRGEMQTETSSLKSLPSGFEKRHIQCCWSFNWQAEKLGVFWFLRFFFFLHRHLWHSLLNSLVLLHPPCLPMLSHYRLIMEIFLSLCSGKHPFKPDVWDQKDWPRICTGADMKEWKFHSQTFSGTSSLLPKRSHAQAGSDTPTAFPEWSQLLLKLRRATSLMDRGHEHDWEQLPAK